MTSVASSRIVAPTQAELDRASEDFDRDWGAVDEVLYDICRRYPDHSDRRGLTAKIALVGRAYSAGLERRVTPPEAKQAITVIADFVHEHRAEVDAIVADVRELREPLTAAAMRDIVDLHGRFCTLLRGVATDGKTPRSFAAKYLHFHNPAVPIYDSYAVAGLSRLVRWDSTLRLFDAASGADEEYYAFCVRFWRLYEECLRAGRTVTVKSLDTYLWAAP